QPVETSLTTTAPRTDGFLRAPHRTRFPGGRGSVRAAENLRPSRGKTPSKPRKNSVRAAENPARTEPRPADRPQILGALSDAGPGISLLRSRGDPIGRDEEGPGGNGIARGAMILAQLPLGPLPEAAPVGIDHEGIAIRDAGPKRAPEGAAEQPVQV